MAAPVVSDFQVIGLLEVFSPRPRGFTPAHETVLNRLVEMIPKTNRENTPPENVYPEKAQPEPPIGPEAVVAAVSQPPASQSGSMKLGSTDYDSVHGIREALRERNTEVPEQVSHQVPGEIVAEPVPEQAAELAPAAPSRLLYRTLLGLAVVVVAMVVGYLISPMMEKHWADSPQAAQRSLADGSEATPGQNSADQRPPAKSLADLRKLADHGNAEAQWQLGVSYHTGEYVPRDDRQAMQWFQRAAEQGHVTAQATLGAYYWAGRGVPQDLSKAYFWSALAFAQGDDNSKSRLEGLASQMTQAQVSAARQQAEVWVRAHSQRVKSEAN